MLSESARTDTDFETLHALRIKGFVSVGVLAAIVDLDEVELGAILDRLVESGWVSRRETPRMSGVTLTPDGKIEEARLFEHQLADPRFAEASHHLHEAFLPINGDFKRVCSRWQTRPDGSANAHDDADYDRGVIAEVAAINARVREPLAIAGRTDPRFARYLDRLASTLARLEAGESAALLRPMSESYHDIWMELHQDLILSSGRERDERDEG